MNRKSSKSICSRFVQRDEPAGQGREVSLYAAFEHLDEGIVLSDLDGNLIHWNRAALEAHGFTREDDSLRKLTELDKRFELSDSEGTVLALEQWPITRILGGEELRNVEIRVFRKDTGQRWFFRYGGGLIRGAEGRPVMALMTIHDITGQQQDLPDDQDARALLLRERDKLTNILDSMPDGIYIVNREHELEYCNPSLIRQLGPMDRKKCYEYLCDRTEPCEQCGWEAVEQGRTMRMELHHTRTGKTFDAIDAPLMNPDGHLSKLKILHDITDYKQAEKKIRDLALFPSENPSPVLRIHQDGTILYSNEPGLCFLESWGRKVQGKVPDEWGRRIRQALRSGRMAMYEETVRDRFFSCVLAPVQDAGYVNVYGQDVTQRVKTEQDLQHAHDELEKRVQERTLALAQTVNTLQTEVEDRIRAERLLWDRSRELDAFFAHSLTPLVILDKSFNFLRVNRAYADSCGRSVEDFAGQNHFVLYPHAENQRIFEEAVRRKKPCQFHAKPFSFPDHPEWGVTYWDWTLVPILNKRQEVEFLLFSLRDVTERQKAENALLESEEKYRSLVEVSPDAICVIHDERIVFTNQMAADLVKVSNPDQLLGRSIWEFVPDASRPVIQKSLVDVYRIRRKLPGFEMHLIRADGSEVEVEVSGAPYIYQGYPAVVTVFRDITDRKQAQRELQISKEKLRTLTAELQLVEERERRKIAYELHDSIGQILAFSCREIQGLRKQSPAHLIRLLEEVETHLHDAVQRTRTLSFDLSPSILYDLGFEVAVEDLADRFSRDHAIRCDFENDAADKPLEEHVQVLLYRSVRELLINVAKHAEANHVRILMHRQNDHYRITVQDNGQGFSYDAVQNSAGRQESFGLFSIRERLDHVGGTFLVEAAPGKGTRIILQVPLKASS